MGCRHLLEDIQKSFWAVRVELDDRKVIQEGGNREEERGEFSLRGEFGWRGLVGRRHSLVGCLRGRRAVRFLAHLAGESYFEVCLLCILRQLLLVCFSTMFLLILG